MKYFFPFALRELFWSWFHPVIWWDKIQEDAPLGGFHQFRTASQKTDVLPDDINGANISRIPNPFGPGFCLRLYGDLSQPGSFVRSQAGVWLWKSPELTKAVDDGCYFEQWLYIPEVLSANGDPYSFLGRMDIHVLDENQGNRSYFGLNIVQDGSMRATLVWGGPLYMVNRDYGTSPPTSKISLPVGRWFRLRTYFKRTAEPSTVRVWFDDELALEWAGVINSLPSNTRAEWYGAKIYGAVQHNNTWGKVVSYYMNGSISK